MLPELITAQTAELQNGDILTLPCEMNYYFITTEAEAKAAVELLLPVSQDPNSMLAVDIETTGFDQFTADILLTQIGVIDDRQYVFDMRLIDYEIIRPVLEGPCWKIGQNLKFEGKFFKHKWNLELTHLFDTMLAEMVIRGGSGGRRGYGLDQIISKRLGLDMTLTRRNLSGIMVKESEQEAERAKKVMQLSFTKMEPGQDFSDAQLAYAASDVSSGMIIQLAMWQMGRLMEPGPNALYDPASAHITDSSISQSYEELFPRTLTLWDTASLEFTFLEVVIDLELRGIGFNQPLHEKVLDSIGEDYQEYRSAFLESMSDGVKQTTLFGTAAINPDSPKQVLANLQDVGIDLEDSTKAEALEELLRDLKDGTKNYDIVASLLGYRKSAKLINTYGEKLRKKVHHVTDRLHYTVQQILDTGRMSTSNPNLQNIPAKIAWKPSDDEKTNAEIRSRTGIRECFIPREGYEYLIYDYSAQEMRIAAHITMDKGLGQAFRDDRDLHAHAASLMYNEDYDVLHDRAKAEEEEDRKKLGITLEQHLDAKKKRSAGKTLNFASMYGSGAKNISEKLHIPLDQAQNLLDRYWESFPQVKASLDRYGKFAAKHGYSNTILGRRRYYTDFLDKIKWVEACKTPDELTEKLKELKLDWILEKGPITFENMKKVKKQAEKKYHGDIHRQAGNHHVQGSAAGMTKIFSISLRRALKEKNLDAFLVGLIHDEAIVESHVDCSEEVALLVQKHMLEAQQHLCPTIPAATEGGSSLHWKK